MEWPAARAPLSIWLGVSIVATAVFLLGATTAHAALNTPERVADIQPGSSASNPSGITPFGRQVIFRAASDAAGDEAWATDGTAAGTRPLQVAPGAGSSIPGGFTDLGDVVVFLAIGEGGDELWRTDGTPAGTARVRDINPGPASSSPRGFVDVGDQAVFKADDGVTGDEPWRTDGTAAGTERIVDLNPGAPSGAGGFFFPILFGSHVLFSGNEPTTASEVWRVPITGSGAELVANVRLAGDSSPLELTAAGDTVFFTADDGVVGRELWRTDGEPGGDYGLVEDFDGAATDSGVAGLARFGNHVYFRVNGGDGNGVELWRADEGGAELVADINPAGNSNPAHLTPVGDWLYFAATTAAGEELWRTDGVPGGTTEMVADIDPGGSSLCSFPDIVELGGLVYFCADDGVSGTELWRTDGSGASRVADISPGAGSALPRGMTAHGDALYFSATDGGSGAELWALDVAAPDTGVGGGPSAGSRIADRRPAFDATSAAIDLDRYECSPTGAGGSYRECGGRDGEVTFPRLPDGQHPLRIRSVDVRDNADPTPVVIPLTVDATGPRVVVRGRLKPSGGRAARVKLLCKRSERSGPCRGKALLRTAKGKRAKLGRAKLKLKPGKAKRVKVKLTRRGRAVLDGGAPPPKLKLKGRARDRLGNERRFAKRVRLAP